MRASVDSRDMNEAIDMDAILQPSSSTQPAQPAFLQRFPYESLLQESHPAPEEQPDPSEARSTYYEHRRRDMPHGNNSGPPSMLSCLKRD